MTMTMVVYRTSFQVARHHRLSHGCVEEQRSRPGDQLAVHFQQLGENGALVNSTEGGEPFTFILGNGEALEGWDEGLRKLCAGEIVKLVVASESASKTYVITLDLITRTMKLQTVARIPNCEILLHLFCLSYQCLDLYLSYPHPTANTPVRIKMRGIRGIKIDSSQDTIKTGESHLVPG